MRRVDHAQLRPYEHGDRQAVLALNAEHVPEVGELDEARLKLFHTDPRVTFFVVDLESSIVGLFVGLPEGVAYDSANYRWFAERHDRFHYVDRIALAPVVRGTGLADELYDRWEEAARRTRSEVVCAEVNVEPPNPRSMAFHTRRGFGEVAQTAPYGDLERVAMLELPLR